MQLKTMWVLLIVLIILLLISIQQRHASFAFRRWRRSLQLDMHQAAYSQLFANVDGFLLSREARSKSDALEYVYGEIDFIAFIALLSLAKPNKNTVFYDLGSGTGTAVLACAMVFEVAESCGIEIFPLLYHAACEQKKHLSNLDAYKHRAEIIHFFNNNILHANFDSATLIFINATSFFGQTWQEISQRIEQTPNCATVITTSKPLKSTLFTVTKITWVEMSWGIVKAYIHQRIDYTR